MSSGGRRAAYHLLSLLILSFNKIVKQHFKRKFPTLQTLFLVNFYILFTIITTTYGVCHVFTTNKKVSKLVSNHLAMFVASLISKRVKRKLRASITQYKAKCSTSIRGHSIASATRIRRLAASLSPH